MRTLILLLSICLVAAFVPAAMAGDFHVGTNLVCSDCHIAHYSQSHPYTPGGQFTTLGPDGPYEHLLRNDVNDLCLTCHDGQSGVPDVYNSSATNNRRLAGGLNADPAHRPNETGYETTDGHTLWSTATAPGGTFSQPVGLECTDCHAQHGSATQYRNLLNRGNFTGKNLTYEIGTWTGTKDVFERSAAGYSETNVDYEEPNTSASAYAAWCQSCHTDFHGTTGGPEVGGMSGGGEGWVRHPQADVNIGANATYISSLSQFNGHTNRVKVMDSQGLWDGTTADNTVTPSCFSCHKSHGNKNVFGLIFMAGTGTVTEEGDGGVYKDLCRQCHIQGG
ncbi:MAG: hypothetical protein ACM3JJ_07995 [Hyphomicrobiales bacterium]